MQPIPLRTTSGGNIVNENLRSIKVESASLLVFVPLTRSLAYETVENAKFSAPAAGFKNHSRDILARGP